jgi:hypothetical protein
MALLELDQNSFRPVHRLDVSRVPSNILCDDPSTALLSNIVCTVISFFAL